MRDSQKQRCYDWQYKVASKYPVPLNDRLTLEQAQALVEKICTAHGVSVPEVQETWGRSKSYYQKGHRKWSSRKGFIQVPERIRLSTKSNRWGFKLLVVIHEACHALANKYLKNEADHGPTYMRLFFDLIVKFGKLDKVQAAEIRQLARDMGVSIAPKIDYELNAPIRGIIPIVPQRPVVQAPSQKEKPKTRTKKLQPAPTPVVPWLRPSAEPQKYWIRCRKCKEMIVFDEQPLGFQWCNTCKKKGYGS